MGIDYCYN